MYFRIIFWIGNESKRDY